ncbi:heterokaryon incompatibility protein-domain-containing protein, partial [Neurospora tetraspora]
MLYLIYAASSVITGPLVTFFPRQHTLDHSRSWLCTCVHGRGETRHAAGPSYRPKRLLAISQGDPQTNSTFVVIADNTQRVPYATLSYKWGQGQEPILTKKMLREGPGSLQFHIDRLPQTIADAVFVCQSLGIGYLWVDALCIIQDDGQDKAEQIGQMQQIYSQSTITIVASRANSSRDGFLHPRLLGDAYCRLTYRSKGGNEGSIILHRVSRQEEALEPLHERGWAYQEFLLPPRVIDYGRLQTKYHCRECESTITDGGRSSESAKMLLTRRGAFYELLKRCRATWNLKYMWCLFVEECSRRHLTIPADRLNAFSAIAEVVSKLTDQMDEYLAGHWRSNLPRSLMWRNLDELGVKYHSSEEYIAPSWSWASVVGKVRFGGG